MKEQLKWNEPWIMQRADPYIYRHTDGCYYFTASVPAYDRIILRRADSLAGLAGAVENTVWTKHKSGIMSEHIWRRSCITWMVNGIFILPQEKRRISGRSGPLCWNVRMRIP